MKRKFHIAFLLWIHLIIPVHSFAQAPNLDGNLNFEISVQQKFNRLQKCREDELRTSINDSIYNEIKSWVKSEETFDYELDTLKSIGYLKSEDGNLKIITWNLPLMEGYNLFFGFLQYRTKDKVHTIELKYNEDSQFNLEKAKTIFPNNWYGALYYEILINKYKGENYYTLLGFIPNDIFTSKKVIDILTISDDGMVSFGKPVFNIEQGAKSRLVFEYSARVVMKLSYNQKMEMIVYDHLSPSSPNYTGRFQFYGPDFSYDGLKFENGRWQEFRDINIEY